MACHTDLIGYMQPAEFEERHRQLSAQAIPTSQTNGHPLNEGCRLANYCGTGARMFKSWDFALQYALITYGRKFYRKDALVRS